MDNHFPRRYPDDPYDRLWEGATYTSLANISTQETIQQDDLFEVPIPVLRTGVTALGNVTALNGTWDTYKRSFGFKIILHFADFQNRQVRLFDVNVNDMVYQNFSPPYLSNHALYNTDWYKSIDGKYNISMRATNKSMLPPMFNAYELYNLIHHDIPRTFSKDCEMSPTLTQSFIFTVLDNVGLFLLETYIISKASSQFVLTLFPYNLLLYC
jgi:hypothetical protein